MGIMNVLGMCLGFTASIVLGLVGVTIMLHGGWSIAAGVVFVVLGVLRFMAVIKDYVATDAQDQTEE